MTVSTETLSIADLRNAGRLWDKLAPIPAKYLLEATGEDDRDPLAHLVGLYVAEALYQQENPDYVFDSDAMRYKSFAGRLVSEAGVRSAIDDFATAARAETTALANAYAAGDLSAPQFIRAMKDLTAALHLAAHVAGQGGWRQMDDAAFADAERAVAEQWAYIDKFGEDLAEFRVTDGRLLPRANAYANTLGLTFEASRYAAMERLADAGVVVLAKNVLGQAEHCRSEAGETGCLNETARGFVPMRGMSRPGSRRCRIGCRCFLTYRVQR